MFFQMLKRKNSICNFDIFYVDLVPKISLFVLTKMALLKFPNKYYHKYMIIFKEKIELYKARKYEPRTRTLELLRLCYIMQLMHSYF